jgi:hypothetical protein
VIKDERGLSMTGPDFSSAVWRKSSRSGSSNGGGGTNCVELAHSAGMTGVRDSKRPGVQLAFSRAAFATFLASTRKFN